MQRRDVELALDRAKATLARTGTRGDFEVAPRGVTLSVTWTSPHGTNRTVARAALLEAVVELQAAGFDAALPYGLDWVRVCGVPLGEQVSDRRDGEAATLNGEPDASTERECELTAFVAEIDTAAE